MVPYIYRRGVRVLHRDDPDTVWILFLCDREWHTYLAKDEANPNRMKIIYEYEIALRLAPGVVNE